MGNKIVRNFSIHDITIDTFIHCETFGDLIKTMTQHPNTEGKFEKYFSGVIRFICEENYTSVVIIDEKMKFTVTISECIF